MHQAINPPGWPRPKGYSNGIVAKGRFLAIAGMIGWDENEKLVGEDFLSQFRKALQNVADVLTAAEGGPEHLISLTIYVTDKHEYTAQIKEVGAAYRDILEADPKNERAQKEQLLIAAVAQPGGG